MPHPLGVAHPSVALASTRIARSIWRNGATVAVRDRQIVGGKSRGLFRHTCAASPNQILRRTCLYGIFLPRLGRRWFTVRPFVSDRRFHRGRWKRALVNCQVDVTGLRDGMGAGDTAADAVASRSGGNHLAAARAGRLPCAVVDMHLDSSLYELALRRFDS
jgi:hypothetical protein